MLTRDYVPDRLPYSLPLYATKASPVSRLITAPVIDASVETLPLLSALVAALPNGLLVLSSDRTIMYWNQNAKRLCQKLSSTQCHRTTLPTIVSELCEQVVEADATIEPIVLEYQTPEAESYRLTACWLKAGVDAANHHHLAISHQTYMLVTVENRDEVLQQDIQVEQKKFHLTNREAEIWLLLKREYSYQAIATALHISLNTVKTHVRNIHAKRHPHQSLPA